MATKRITWTTETKFEVEILEGPATGKYQDIDIESYECNACNGLIKIGHIGKQDVMVKTSDIPDYEGHYNKTPRALKFQRENLVANVNGCFEDAQSAQDKSYESGDGTGRWANAGDKYFAKVAGYKKELAEFDAVHPEIIAKIEADKKESVARHMWD